MSRPDTTSSSVLAESAYRDDRYLAARQSLYRWQRPTYDLPDIVLRRLPARSGIVLDVGCGNGRYLERIRARRSDLRVIGVDVSAGILKTVPASVLVADAAALPIADHCSVAVLAMHMLYHVEHIEAALAEAVRVLRPGGAFVASTNARDDKRELDDLWSAAAADVLGVKQGPRRISLSSRFSLDDAPAVLQNHFDDIDVLELPGTIRVREPDPVIAHLASYRTWAQTAGVPFDATLERARQILHRELTEHGEFRISCRGGILFCRSR